MPRLQPLHFALFGFVAAILASYVAAATRPIRGIELSGADRGLLGVLAWVGMFVMMSDRLPTRKSLDTVLWRLHLHRRRRRRCWGWRSSSPARPSSTGSPSRG